MIDVTKTPKVRDVRHIQFIVGGDLRLCSALPNPLAPYARAGGTLADYTAREGVADWFDFRGYVDDSERLLAEDPMLAKPTREANPWGQDIIEAQALGARRPMVTVECYDKFVEDGVTGVLTHNFDPSDWAEAILTLAANPVRRRAMAIAAQKRTAKLCEDATQATATVTVWRSGIDQRRNACK